jgi:hypothetical protein
MKSDDEVEVIAKQDLIGFFVLASISMITITGVVYHLYRYRDINRLRYRLLLLLYVSSLLEEFAYLPFIYQYDLGLCKFMGFFHYYWGLVNVLTVFMIGMYHFSYINNENYSEKIKKFLFDYGFKFSLLFPLITLLPFSSRHHGYKAALHIWCTLPLHDPESNRWAFGVFYTWVILFLVIAVIELIYSLYRLSKFDKNLRNELFLSCGIYILLSFVAWIPRILFRAQLLPGFSEDVSGGNLATMAQIYIAGFWTAVVYFSVLLYSNNRRRRLESQSSVVYSSIDVENLKASLIEQEEDSRLRQFSDVVGENTSNDRLIPQRRQVSNSSIVEIGRDSMESQERI